MATMRAWLCGSFSGPVQNNLYLAESVPMPKPSDAEVLVEVHSTTINPIDYKVLEQGFISKAMFRSPVTPGLDISGRVVQVGSESSPFKVGDMVWGSCNGVFGHGALAQYVLGSQETLALIPKALKAGDLAAIACVGMTTLQAIRPYVKAGDRIFINGGSGGTGVLAIQIAKALGCHVTTSCSTANIELCQSLGADKVLDYKKADVIGQLSGQELPFSLIVDNVGAPSNLYRSSDKYLVPSGTFVQVGLGMNLSALQQFLSNLLLPGVLGGGRAKYVFAMTKSNREDLDQLATWMEQGRIRAVIDSTYKFMNVPEAFAKLKTGRACGKVVVQIQEA